MIVDCVKTWIVLGALVIAGFAMPAPAEAQQDVAVDFGPYGVWILRDLSTWELLNGLNPERMVQGDLDGNAVDDLVIDFAPGYGLWAWMNHATWTRLHPYPTTHALMVTGSFDNNGRDGLVAVFRYGTYLYRNNSWTSWGFEPPFGPATALAVGNVADDAGDELIFYLPGGYPLTIWMPRSTGSQWETILSASPSALLAADLDGNGLDEVIANFPGYGLWVYHRLTSTWELLHAFDAAILAAGDLDGTGRDEVIVDFGAPYGLWILVNGTSWQLLTTLSADSAAVGDVDGNGQADVVIDFGPVGLWMLKDTATWQLLHAFNPEGVALGRFH